MDVCYIVEARFALTAAATPSDHPGRHAAMFRRRATNGPFFRQPFLRRRDCPADVRLAPDGGHAAASAYAGSGPGRSISAG